MKSFLIFLFSATVMFHLCAQNSLENTKDTLNFKTFTDDGYVIKYPSDWKIDKTSAYPAIVFLSPYESDYDMFAENFNIVKGYKKSNETFENYISSFEMAMGLILSNIKISKSEIIESKNGKCCHIIYQGTQKNTAAPTFYFEQYFWIIGDYKTIAITFTCIDPACSEYKEIFQNILETFSIVGE